ncbi:MAG: hypothetical protein LIP03_10015 [Bacteroidales bacterium]|nr:hypothetical protein [Bacteroidales bacterium]
MITQPFSHFYEFRDLRESLSKARNRHVLTCIQSTRSLGMLEALRKGNEPLKLTLRLRPGRKGIEIRGGHGNSLSLTLSDRQEPGVILDYCNRHDADILSGPITSGDMYAKRPIGMLTDSRIAFDLINARGKRVFAMAIMLSGLGPWGRSRLRLYVAQEPQDGFSLYRYMASWNTWAECAKDMDDIRAKALPEYAGIIGLWKRIR